MARVKDVTDTGCSYQSITGQLSLVRFELTYQDISSPFLRIRLSCGGSSRLFGSLNIGLGEGPRLKAMLR